MNLSTQKKINPPIRLATTVAASFPAEASYHKTTANIGILNCHLAKYNRYLLIFTFISIPFGQHP